MITGFTRIKTGGTFAQADLDAIFAEIKNRLSAASLQENTPTVFRFGPAGVTPGQDTDDTPFWRFENDTANGWIAVQACVGQTGGAMGTLATDTNSFESVLMKDARDSVHFACSPAEGWWWMAAQNSQSPGSGRIVAGCRMRRVASDMTSGLFPRFGLLTVDPYSGAQFRLPYATGNTGTILTGMNAILPAVSPMGIGSATRHNGSALPKGIAPIYPAPRVMGTMADFSPAIFGDADCAMMATDGFARGEEVAPGWRVFGHTAAMDKNVYLALRSPATFDVS